MTFRNIAFLLIGFAGIAAIGATRASEFGTDMKSAFISAKRDKKPLLISFFGVWCPACNELEEMVFESARFLEHSKNFILLKMDADSSASWSLKDRYRIGGYPTVVFTDPNGEEIYRVVGYRSPVEFLTVIERVLSAKGINYRKACRRDRVDDLSRCLEVCLERDDSKCVEKAYQKLQAKLKPGSDLDFEVKTYFVERSSNDDLKRDGFERLLKEAPANILAVHWVERYLALSDESSRFELKKPILEKVLEHLGETEQRVADNHMSLRGFSLTDVIQTRAELLSRLGKKEEAKAAWKRAVTELDKLAKILPAGSPARGFTLERISCLEQAGDADAALKLAEEYRTKFPQEFTFHYRAAMILFHLNKYSEALSPARKAFEVSYGDNQIRSAVLLLKILATQSAKEEIDKIYRNVRQAIRPDSKLAIRTHRYLLELEKVRQAYK